MHISDWLILTGIALLFFAAVRSIVRKKKRGGGCCGDCTSCGGCLNR